MDIFANHAHLWPEGTYPSVKGGVNNLLRVMDKCGLAKTVVYAPLPGELGKEDDHSRNKWLLNEIKRHSDRLIPFANITVIAPTASKEVIWAKENGFKGIKLHPAVNKFDILDERAFDFYQEAQKQKLILDFHTGVHSARLQDSHPLKFDEIASRFPNLVMIFEHVGGFCFFYDMLAVIQNNKKGNNLYAGLTSVFSKERQKEWYLGPKKVEELIWQIGEGQLIYGLDFPWNQQEHILEDLSVFAQMDISDQTRKKILGGNLKRLLKMSE